MTFVVRAVQLDRNSDGSITQVEFIKGLKQNNWVADKLGKHEQSSGSTDEWNMEYKLPTGATLSLSLSF